MGGSSCSIGRWGPPTHPRTAQASGKPLKKFQAYPTLGGVQCPKPTQPRENQLLERDQQMQTVFSVFFCVLRFGQSLCLFCVFLCFHFEPFWRRIFEGARRSPPPPGWAKPGLRGPLGLPAMPGGVAAAPGPCWASAAPDLVEFIVVGCEPSGDGEGIRFQPAQFAIPAPLPQNLGSWSLLVVLCVCFLAHGADTRRPPNSNQAPGPVEKSCIELDRPRTELAKVC